MKPRSTRNYTPIYRRLINVSTCGMSDVLDVMLLRDSMRGILRKKDEARVRMFKRQRLERGCVGKERKESPEDTKSDKHLVVHFICERQSFYA
jgi:hypothetical protein